MVYPIRQGDVLLVPVYDVVPPKKQPVVKEVILAFGELAGHAHRLGGTIMEWNVGEQRYVRVLGREKGTLSHEDHDPVPAAVVEPGVTYRVVPQHTFELGEQWARVHD